MSPAFEEDGRLLFANSVPTFPASLHLRAGPPAPAGGLCKSTGGPVQINMRFALLQEYK